MKLWLTVAAIAALSFAATGIIRAQAPADGPAPASLQPAQTDSADTALAERFAQMAQLAVSGKLIVPATLRQSAALLEAANRLAPDEPRFLRLLTEAYLQIGGDEGRDGAISSLTRYLRIDPARLVAQMKLIDLYASREQTADGRMRYLEQLLKSDRISAEVRSHVSFLAAKVALERAEMDSAKTYLEQALSLMPLSPEALRLKYQMLDKDASASDRIALLLQMLRSNPAQSGVMSQLAGELADQGLVDGALSWFQECLRLSDRLSQEPSPGLMTAYAAELVIADQLQVAESTARKLVDADASNTDAAMLLLIIAKRDGTPDKISAALDRARTAELANLSRILNEAKKLNPTTQQAGESDIAADAKQLAETHDPELTRLYAAGLADLAWLDIYFAQKPADADKAMAALRQLVPADSGILARLEGWTYLDQGKKDEAKVKLSAVADRDPLAALGMLRADPASTPEQTTAAIKRLLNEHASGMVGALLIEAVRDRVGLMPAVPGAEQIRTQVDAFPRDLLEILDFSRVKNFYSIQAEPLRVAMKYGDPVLAKITLTNTSKYDLTVGEQGAIHPDLWFDVQVKGLLQTTIPGVAIDRIGHGVLLKPRGAISTVVRVDQDGLSALMQQNPVIVLPLYFTVLTNPMTQQNGIAPGPGGYRTQFSSVVERGPTPLSEQTFNDLFGQVLNGSGEVRLRTIDLLNAISRMLKGQTGDAKLQGKATEIVDVIRKRTGDVSPSVRAYATLTTALLSDKAVREGMIRQMLQDPTMQQRVLGIIAVHLTIDADKRKEFIEKLAKTDTDPIVKSLAQSELEVSDLPAATQPSGTTQPAGADGGEAPAQPALTPGQPAAPPAGPRIP